MLAGFVLDNAVVPTRSCLSYGSPKSRREHAAYSYNAQKTMKSAAVSASPVLKVANWF